jgi:hypothetical protein
MAEKRAMIFGKKVLPKYQTLLEKRLKAFVVASSFNIKYFDITPFGLEILPENIINPLRTDSQYFLGLLQTLDRKSFGAEGLNAPKWLFYDCAEFPGGIFGFGIPSNELSLQARQVMEVDKDYQGLVPMSMLIAIPMIEPGVWMSHTLSSLNLALPEEKLFGLGALTKTMAVKVFRTRKLYGATQWNNLSIYIHVKFGSLKLITAYTPAHSLENTFTYCVDINDAVLTRILTNDSPTRNVPYNFFLKVDDIDHMKKLQHNIEEKKAEYWITGPPCKRDNTYLIPIREIPHS